MKTSWLNYMVKIKKNLYKKYINDIDVICQILDSRIPESSYNYDLEKVSYFKKKIIILNKIDLSNINNTKKWVEYFNKQEKTISIMTDNKNKIGINNFFKIINDIYKKKQSNSQIIKNNKIKVMMIGTPNVGKSTFINSILGKRTAKCGNKSGITKGFQWFNIHDKIDLLDCPGIFCSKMNDINKFYLSVVGSIEENSLYFEDTIYKLINILFTKHKNNIVNFYNISLPNKNNKNIDNYIADILYNIAIKRGLFFQNNNIDDDRLYKLLLNDFRSGKLGKFTLELPIDNNIIG